MTRERHYQNTIRDSVDVVRQFVAKIRERAAYLRIQSEASPIANLLRSEIIFVAIKINIHSRVSLRILLYLLLPLQLCALRMKIVIANANISRYFEKRKSMFRLLRLDVIVSERKEKYHSAAGPFNLEMSELTKYVYMRCLSPWNKRDVHAAVQPG